MPTPDARRPADESVFGDRVVVGDDAAAHEQPTGGAMNTTTDNDDDITKGDAAAPPSKPGNIILKISDLILETLALTTVVTLMLLTVANAVLRYVFGAPIPGSLNFTLLFLMPAVVFLALPRVQALEAHISANLFVARMGPLGQYLCALVSRIVILLTTLLMFLSATVELRHAWSLWLGGFPPLPVGPSWLMACIGLAGVIIRVIWQIATSRPDRESAKTTSIAEFATKEFDGV